MWPRIDVLVDGVASVSIGQSQRRPYQSVGFELKTKDWAYGKWDNGSDHRAGTIILQAEKSARKPGLACMYAQHGRVVMGCVLVRTRMLGGVGGARRKPAPIPIAMLSDVLVICYTFRRMQANCELRLTAWRGTLLATKKPKKFAD